MIGLIGISYKTASIEKREKFSFRQEEIVPFADYLDKEIGITDLVLLSTCNRTELYFSQTQWGKYAVLEKLKKAFSAFKGIKEDDIRAMYNHFDNEVPKHLFRVAAGLDSMIIGEDQIIGQIKNAYLYCTNAGLTDALLMRLFQKSFEAGKRVRTETGISMGNLSISSTAVMMLEQTFDDLSDKSLLLIGTGDTGTLALQNICKKKIGNITLMNRSHDKAEALARSYNAEVLSYESLRQSIGKYDIVMVATSAPHYLITKETLATAKAHNPKDQMFIDLSVPRNIEENVTELDGVTLCAVDDLEKVIERNTEKRKAASGKANMIIDEVAEEYYNWVISRSLRPAIKHISENLKAVYTQELENFEHIKSEEIKNAVNRYTRHITQRYTRLFIHNLKEITDNGRHTDSLNIIDELFKLEENNRRKS